MVKYKVVNKSNSLNFEQFKPLLSSFMNFATKRFGFKKPPSLFFISDAENAKMPLGKTAHYDPSCYGVTIFTDGRHPKDILRSLSHELVHHKQNCEGQFDDMGEAGDGYAQTNPHLRQMEIEANRDGSMCLRDWEDNHKKQLQESSYYLKGDKKMKLNEWKNAELASLLKEKFNIPECEYKRDTEEEQLEEELEEEELEEGGLANRKGDPRQRRPEASPIREKEEDPEEGLEEGWEEELAAQEEEDVAKYKADRPPTTISSKGGRLAPKVRASSGKRQRTSPKRSGFSVSEEKIRKTVREILKKYVAK